MWQIQLTLNTLHRLSVYLESIFSQLSNRPTDSTAYHKVVRRQKQTTTNEPLGGGRKEQDPSEKA